MSMIVPLLTEEPADRVLVLDLGGCVRAVPQLVLEALDADRVAGPVG